MLDCSSSLLIWSLMVSSQIRNLSCQLLIVAYREAKKRDPEIAQSLVNSFTTDYPNVPESTLLPRWCSLAQASLAMREVAQSHLSQSYLAAISVIAIMEEEYELGKKVFPPHLVKVFEF